MNIILIFIGSILLFITNTSWADIKMNCSVYQDGKLLTTQEKTLTSQQLNSSWANNHPDKFANNYFKQALCQSVGLGQDRKKSGATIRGVKYHGVTVYNNQSVSPSCKVQCVKANSGTQPATQLDSLNQHQQNMSTLALATGYITGAAK